LAQDYLYNDATKNVIFLDNHDVSRFYSMVNEDIEKFKMGIAFLFTTRGIPMLYYGTEVLMKNYANPDGKVREDFVGGWKTDAVNKFTKEGRTEKENIAFDYIKTLALYRKTNPALISGKLTQFVPEKGVYVYFRTDNKNTVMVIINTNETSSDIELNRYSEFIAAKKQMRDIINDKPIEISSTFHIEKTSVMIIDLK
jgi:glycosidase